MAKTTQKTFVTGQNDGPVECLGMTFPNDQARREYFTEKLHEKPISGRRHGAWGGRTVAKGTLGANHASRTPEIGWPLPPS